MSRHAFIHDIHIRTVQNSFLPYRYLKQLNSKAPKIDLEIEYFRFHLLIHRIEIIHGRLIRHWLPFAGLIVYSRAIDGRKRLTNADKSCIRTERSVQTSMVSMFEQYCWR